MEHGKLNGVPSPKHDMKFRKVKHLIEYLEILGKERDLLVDLDGSTWPMGSRHVKLWDENDPDSPVAFIAPLDWED
jgi:hypothetical protein